VTEGDGANEGTRAAEISGAILGVTIRYVRNILGEAGVDELLRLAGQERPLAELEDVEAWTSYVEGVALLEAAAELTGDLEVARLIGEETFRQYGGTSTASSLRSLGSPAEILANVSATGTKFTTRTTFESVDIDHDHATVVARSRDGQPRHRSLCLFTMGVISQVTPLFGLPRAMVSEHQCQAKGADHCRYEVRWDPVSTDLAENPERRASYLESELAAANARFDAVYDVAADLVSAANASSVLARLTARAASAVQAPAYVLAVRLPPSGLVEVHHHGLADTDAAAAAEALLADGGTPPPSWLVADIATPQQTYGRLAAVYPDGGHFFPHESRILDVYARFAAAVLDTTTALEQAEERDATARALLELARALSQVGTREEIALRLTAAVPAVVGCDRAAVLEWDDELAVLRGFVSHGLPPELEAAVGELVIHRDDTPYVQEILDHPRPRVLERDRIDPFLASVFDQMGFKRMAVVPIVAHGAFFGVLAAGSSVDDLAAFEHRKEQLVERLTGLAHQAAMAFSNAGLLEEARHQALHDPLTGLANRRLLEEAAGRAIATAERTGASVGLLFLDLDGFKAVNDDLGHAAGDLVLRRIADTLQEAVRGEDTVARFSGDEFAVLLPRVEDREQAGKVARKLSDALSGPIQMGGRHLRLTASVGIALVPDDAGTYDELLHHADTAMYRMKSQRRAGDPARRSD
jgi:diguanylate cyclase (GGDEF)-like protein